MASEEMLFENVDDGWMEDDENDGWTTTTDRQWMPAYTINSPEGS